MIPRDNPQKVLLKMSNKQLISDFWEQLKGCANKQYWRDLKNQFPICKKIMYFPEMLRYK